MFNTVLYQSLLIRHVHVSCIMCGITSVVFLYYMDQLPGGEVNLVIISPPVVPNDTVLLKVLHFVGMTNDLL